MLNLFRKYIKLFYFSEKENEELINFLKILKENEEPVKDIKQKLEFSIVINDFPNPSLRFGYFKANQETLEKAISKYVSKNQLSAVRNIFKRNLREFATGLELKRYHHRRIKLYSLKLEDITDKEINKTIITPINRALYKINREHTSKYKISIIGVDWINNKPTLKIYEHNKDLEFQILKNHINFSSFDITIPLRYLDDCWLLTRFGQDTSKSIFFSFNQVPKQEVHTFIKNKFLDNQNYFNEFIKKVNKIGEITYTFLGVSDKRKYTLYFGLK